MEIINQVNQCTPCQKFHRKAETEHILQQEPPHRTWERLSSDLFQFKGQQIPRHQEANKHHVICSYQPP